MSELLYCATHNKWKSVEFLVNEHIKAGDHNVENASEVLHLLLSVENKELIKAELVGKFAKIMPSSKMAQNLLLEFELTHGNSEYLEALAKNGADLFVTDAYGRNLLHQNCSAGCLLFLVEHGLNVNDVDFFGNTPLHLKLLSASMAKLGVLFAAGANLEMENGHGQTPSEYITQLSTRRRREIAQTIVSIRIAQRRLQEKRQTNMRTFVEATNSVLNGDVLKTIKNMLPPTTTREILIEANILR